MASGQTEKYGLNQWEPGDQVLREEFNEDNRRVEAALLGMERRVKLKTVTLAEECASIDIPVDDLDIARYDRLGVMIQCGTDDLLQFRLNGLSGTYAYDSTSALNGGSEATNATTLVKGTFGLVDLELFPITSKNWIGWRGHAYCPGSVNYFMGHTTQLSYPELHTLNFFIRDTNNNGYKFRAGSTFRLYGISEGIQ